MSSGTSSLGPWKCCSWATLWVISGHFFSQALDSRHVILPCLLDFIFMSLGKTAEQIGLPVCVQTLIIKTDYCSPQFFIHSLLFKEALNASEAFWSSLPGEGRKRAHLYPASSGSFPLSLQSAEAISKCIFSSRTHCWECERTGDLKTKRCKGFCSKENFK